MPSSLRSNMPKASCAYWASVRVDATSVFSGVVGRRRSSAVEEVVFWGWGTAGGGGMRDVLEMRVVAEVALDDLEVGMCEWVSTGNNSLIT